MTPDVLKEFLVRVGFKVDEAGLKRLSGGLGDVTKMVGQFALGAAAMAAAVGTAVVKVTRTFDDLFYASSRIGSSVGSIKAYEYAISQVGGTAAGARASLENLAEFMRSNAGGEAYINKALGVATAGRETVDIMRDIAKRLTELPYPRAKQVANRLGIDTATLQAMRRDSDAFFQDYQDSLRKSGVDMDAAAEAAQRLSQRLGEVKAKIAIVTDGLLTSLVPALERFIASVGQADKSSAEWANKHPEAAQKVGGLVAAIAGLNAALHDVAVFIWRYIGPAMKELAEGMIRSVLNRIDRLTHDLLGLTAILRGDWATAWQEAGKSAQASIGGVINRISTAITAIRRLWYSLTHRGAEMPANTAAAGTASAAGAASGATPGASGATPTGTPIRQALDYFRRMGWSGPQAAGIVANLQSESGLRTGAVGDGGRAFGLAQWHPDRQAAFKRWSGKDIRESTFAEQLAFVHYELTRGEDPGARSAGRRLRGARTAWEAGGIVSRGYERPADREGEADKRAGLANRLFVSPALMSAAPPVVTIHQTNTVSVSGVSDPQAAASAIGHQQRHLNAELVRNARVGIG